MSSERKDEFLSWRGRLDSPEGVPGQGLDDHEQGWQRLMDRFREKPRRRLPVYGIVAACLLLAVIGGSRLFRDGAKDTGRIPVVVRPVARPDGGREVFTAAAERPSDGSDRKHLAPPAKPGTGRITGGRSKGNVHPEMRTVAVTEDTIRSLEAPAAPLLSQIPPAGPVPQQKWRVVDLNELNSGWQRPHSMAGNLEPGSLRIGPGKFEPGAAGAVPPGGVAPGSPAIRIKLSP